jgi:aspartate kinase
MEGVVVRGVSLDKNQAKVTLVGVPDKPGMAARVFKAIGDADHERGHDRAEHQPRQRHPRHRPCRSPWTNPICSKPRRSLTASRRRSASRKSLTDEKIGKLSIVGVGMKSHTGVAGKMFETLATEGVNIGMISTSEIKISVTIDLAKGEQAIKAVHKAFIG